MCQQMPKPLLKKQSQIYRHEANAVAARTNMWQPVLWVTMFNKTQALATQNVILLFRMPKNSQVFYKNYNQQNRSVKSSCSNDQQNHDATKANVEAPEGNKNHISQTYKF